MFELNDEFSAALDVIRAGEEHVFITGQAGVGKTALLRHFVDAAEGKQVVLAPTGVAALHAGGQTIHSFFKFPIGITPPALDSMMRGVNGRVYSGLRRIIIDEASMLRADLLDCIDQFLRRYGPFSGVPFGGAQMIFFGDLYQLPPVITRDEMGAFYEHYRSPYFIDAHAMRDIDLKIIELVRVYRQHDVKFIELLGRIRTNTFSRDDLNTLNSAVRGGQDNRQDSAVRGGLDNRQGSRQDGMKDTQPITLTTINAAADRMNSARLNALAGKAHCATATVRGKFVDRYCPAPKELIIKRRARVMLVVNDQQRQWVNGSMGIVDAIDSNQAVRVTLDNGKQVTVRPYTWSLNEYRWQEGSYEQVEVGSFEQVPMRLAWAVTIHKSQGHTYDAASINTERGAFAPGQMYVALSRCRSLEGLRLLRPLTMNDIMVDHRAVEFYAKDEASARIAVRQR